MPKYRVLTPKGASFTVAGGAEAEQGHSHQNAELGGDLQIGELHGDLRK